MNCDRPQEVQVGEVRVPARSCELPGLDCIHPFQVLQESLAEGREEFLRLERIQGGIAIDRIEDRPRLLLQEFRVPVQLHPERFQETDVTEIEILEAEKELGETFQVCERTSIREGEEFRHLTHAREEQLHMASRSQEISA